MAQFNAARAKWYVAGEWQWIYVSAMKMEAMNISLPAPMLEFVRHKVGRDYGSVSEYFRDLVRQRMKKEIEADLRLLRETGPAKPGPTEKDLETIERIKREVRKDLRARRVRQKAIRQ